MQTKREEKTTSQPPNGKAFTVRKTFSRETSVSLDIQADKGIIWGLLTKSEDYPRWNSTIITIKGAIAKDQKIVLNATIDPKRQFKLKIKEFDEGNRLVWGDAMGNRVYTLGSLGDGVTHFSMVEKISGPLFPLFARMIPPFDNAFETFAKDLKKEAEGNMRSK